DTYLLDAYRDAQGRPTIPQEEASFRQALQDYGNFLKSIGLKPPFRWIAGMENLNGRALYVPAPPGEVRLGYGPNGMCTTDLVTVSGLYTPGDNIARVLKPFFEELYNSCGVARREWQDN